VQPNYDPTNLHQVELRRVAEGDRLARRLGRPRAVRRRLGHMLIRAGGLVAGYPVMSVTHLEHSAVNTNHSVKSC
jgi:hypothetical protein